MKKKILITYFNNGDIKNRAESEAMWNQIMQEHSGLAKTREIVIPSKRLVEFEDGTVVEMLPVENIRGYRATHVYASQSLHGELLSYAKSTVMASETISNQVFDTEGKPRIDRFKTFSINNGKFEIQ